MDAVVAGHDLTCDYALIRPVSAELHLLVNCAVGVKVLNKLRDVVVAVLDAVHCALTRALRVLQIPAADLRQCVLGIGEDDLLSAGEGAVAVAVGDHQCAAALDELNELGIVDLRADNDNADAVVLLGVGLAAFYLLKRLVQVGEDESLGAGVADQNQNGVLIAGDGRDIPPITGYEYAVLVLVSYTCPKRLILPYLHETLEEIKSRKTDAEKDYRVRVVVVGSEIDDPQLIKLIEGCGALVVADRYCYGSFPGRQEIILSDTEDALTQVCRWYLQNTECPRQSAMHRVKYRNDHVAQLIKDFNADGAIYEQMKFCTYWSYERVIASQVMPRDYGIHMLSIDRPYISGQSGQLRTRVQAFVESLEIKKLRTAQKEEN